MRVADFGDVARVSNLRDRSSALTKARSKLSGVNILPLPLEEFLKAHQYTIAALGVLGTFSAVVVSLTTSFIGMRATRTRIKARASINVIVHSTLQGLEKPKYLLVSIRNLGVMPAVIPMSHFSWKLPFARGYFTVLPLDYSQTDEWVAQKKYPVEIKPRSSEIFFLSDINMFREYAQKDLIGNSVLSRFWFGFVERTSLPTTARCSR